MAGARAGHSLHRGRAGGDQRLGARCQSEHRLPQLASQDGGDQSMRRLRRSLAVPALVALTTLLLTACGGSSSSSSSSASKSGSTTSAVSIANSGNACSYKVALITH